jgi:hypothetical protein
VDDVDGLTRALTSISENRQQMASILRDNYTMVEQKASMQKNTETFISEYKKLINRTN